RRTVNKAVRKREGRLFHRIGPAPPCASGRPAPSCPRIVPAPERPMTRKAFVIGHPIAHSKSPLIHGAWLKAYGIDGSYEPIDVAPDALGAFVDQLRKGTFCGGNATIPHKEALLALCDRV